MLPQTSRDLSGNDPHTPHHTIEATTSKTAPLNDSFLSLPLASLRSPSTGLLETWRAGSQVMCKPLPSKGMAGHAWKEEEEEEEEELSGFNLVISSWRCSDDTG